MSGVNDLSLDDKCLVAIYNAMGGAGKAATIDKFFSGKKVGSEDLQRYWEAILFRDYVAHKIALPSTGVSDENFQELLSSLPIPIPEDPISRYQNFRNRTNNSNGYRKEIAPSLFSGFSALLRHETLSHSLLDFLIFCSTQGIPSVFCDPPKSAANELPGEKEARIQKARERLQCYIKELHGRLLNTPSDTIQPCLTIPTSSNINHFANRAIEQVLGRDKEQQHLRDFLECDKNFAWLQLAGVAGQGKSRLALELVLCAQGKWSAGFLDLKSKENSKVDWKSWQPDKPYLMVIDYVIGNEDIIRPFFQSLSFRTDLNHPVRILFVERQRWDKGGFIRTSYNNNKNISSEDGSIILKIDSMESDPYAEWFLNLCIVNNDKKQEMGNVNCRQCLLESRFSDGILELTALDGEALFSIVERIVKSQGAELKISSSEVKIRLNHIDKSGRPLFAYFFGQSLAEGDGMEEDIRSRDDLLRDAVKRQYLKRWKATFPDEVPMRRNDNLAHRLAVIATITKGLDCKQAADIEVMPLPDDDARHRAMVFTDAPVRTDDEHSPGNIVLPLEPDVLGEWMVLDSLKEVLPVVQILEIAWRYRPEETAAFLVRLAQDFGSHLITTEILELSLPTENALMSLSIVCASIARLMLKNAQYVPSESLLKALVYSADVNGDTSSMITLSIIHSRGRGVEKSWDESTKWVAKAADKGDGRAMHQLGIRYAYGNSGVPQSEREAIKWFWRAANSGELYSIGDIALIRFGGLFPDNRGYKKIAMLHRKAASLGDCHAMYRLGKLYEIGQGVRQSYKGASFWYGKAAKIGYHQAMFSLGRLYENNYEVKQNYSVSAELYSRASELGNVDAMKSLGYFYERGYGLTQNYNEAANLYLMAATKGNIEAMIALAKLYEAGSGVTKCFSKAEYWYVMAEWEEEREKRRRPKLLIKEFDYEGNKHSVSFFEVISDMCEMIKNGNMDSTSREKSLTRMIGLAIDHWSLIQDRYSEQVY